MTGELSQVNRLLSTNSGHERKEEEQEKNFRASFTHDIVKCLRHKCIFPPLQITGKYIQVL